VSASGLARIHLLTAEGRVRILSTRVLALPASKGAGGESPGDSAHCQRQEHATKGVSAGGQRRADGRSRPTAQRAGRLRTERLVRPGGPAAAPGSDRGSRRRFARRTSHSPACCRTTATGGCRRAVGRSRPRVRTAAARRAAAGTRGGNGKPGSAWRSAGAPGSEREAQRLVPAQRAGAGRRETARRVRPGGRQGRRAAIGEAGAAGRDQREAAARQSWRLRRRRGW